MASPISTKRAFKLPALPLRQFVSLGAQAGNRGVLHTVFLSRKPVGDDFIAGEPAAINGVGSYSFLTNAGCLCGFFVASPAAATIVKHSSLIIGSESADYSPLFHLQPQGVIVFESSDSNLVLLSLDVASTLLVKVDL